MGMGRVPCPRCGAVGSEPCLTSGGHAARDWHVGRVAGGESVGRFEAAAVRSLAAADRWLTPADELASELVLGMCRRLDELERDTSASLLPGESKKGTTEFYGSSTLVQVLDRLGLTNAGRMALHIDDGNADSDRLSEAIRAHGIRPITRGADYGESDATDLDTPR